MNADQPTPEPVSRAQRFLQFFKPQHISVAVTILATLLAIFLRAPDLTRRPMHTDEAVQAAKTGYLFETNYYKYDPHEFHGPTLYYFTLPVLKLAGVPSYAESTEFHYRLVPVIFGVAVILLTLLVRSGMGRSGAACAAILTAVSPSMTYYSRYYIQEMLLVFFSFALIACGRRWMHKGRWLWAVLAGVCLGLMHATKETFVISIFAMGSGLAVNYFFTHTGPAARSDAFRRIERTITQIGLALIVAMFVSILFYSSFFQNREGFSDSIRTYGNYLKRSSEVNPHDKPWYYYLKLLSWNYSPGAPIWSEALVLALACVGAVHSFMHASTSETDERPAWTGSRGFERFLTIYTVVTIFAYSVIAYKTPWCVLSMQHGLILLAGCGAAAILRALPYWYFKLAAGVLLAAGAAHLGYQAYQATERYAYDPRSPYVYSHPSSSVQQMCAQVREIAEVHPDGQNMLVQVMAPESDYWPIPWYLRSLKRVGYTKAPPAEPDSPVLIAGQECDPELAIALKNKYQTSMYGLRPGVLVTMYVDADLWKKYMEAKSAKRKAGK